MKNKIECIVTRGSKEESRHNINCVVIDENRKILFECGNIKKAYCLRSTLKPFQCAASLKKGTANKYNLSKKEIAIICASHHGETEHIKTIRSILKKINLTEKNLQCGFHYPLNKQNKQYLYSNKNKKSNIYNNCSGKHAGLLAFIKKMNFKTAGYIDHAHPIHKQINTYIWDVAELKSSTLAVDGCSLPTPYFNLLTLATMYMKLITAQKNSELQKVLRAMMHYPQMISGEKGFDTFFMNQFKGRSVSKGGAEGMQALALQTKEHGHISLALKVSDGSHRGNYISCISVLAYLNIIRKSDFNKCMKFIEAQQKNLNNIPTGKLVCNIS